MHVPELLDMILITSPGERVMRPEFGCGPMAPIAPAAMAVLRAFHVAAQVVASV